MHSTRASKWHISTKFTLKLLLVFILEKVCFEKWFGHTFSQWKITVLFKRTKLHFRDANKHLITLPLSGTHEIIPKRRKNTKLNFSTLPLLHFWPTTKVGGGSYNSHLILFHIYMDFSIIVWSLWCMNSFCATHLCFRCRFLILLLVSCSSCYLGRNWNHWSFLLERPLLYDFLVIIFNNICSVLQVWVCLFFLLGLFFT